MYCRREVDTVNPELAATLLVILSAIIMPFKVLVMYMLDLIHEIANFEYFILYFLPFNICRTVLLALVTFLFNIAYFG